MYTDIITYRRSVVDVLYPDSVVPSYIHHDFTNTAITGIRPSFVFAHMLASIDCFEVA